MDTTFSTNRFGWPLCLLCGVDEHYHTVLLAVALLHHQTTTSFEWVLQQLRTAMRDEVWAGVACVFTDGDQAMSAALVSSMPHSKHLRCRYHLKQNLQGKLYSLGVDPAISKQCVEDWLVAAACETEAEFDKTIAALLSSCPALRPYMTGTFPAGHVYADFALNHITTLGVRSTARVESWNGTLKGMLAVNSHTSLTVLFETLRFALSEKDHRSRKRALEDAARRPVNTQVRTIDAETAPHLTYHAQGCVKSQAELSSNYKYDMVQAANPAIFSVYDRRPAAAEVVRTVTTTDTTMECSCGMPKNYLLPCRHVLVVNNHIYNTQFRVSQVGRRWVRAYMPAKGDQSVVSLDDEPALDVSVPSFSSTVSASSANMPSRQAMWGQLQGWCNTLCTIGCQPSMYRYVSDKLQSLCKDVEAQVAKAMRVRLAPAALRSAMSSSSSELHPDVHVQDMRMPAHRKRRLGKGEEQRQKSAFERASAGMRVPAPMTASQSL